MFSPFSPVDIQILSREYALPVVSAWIQEADGLCILATENMIERLHLGPFVKELINRHHGIWIKNVPSNPTVQDVSDALLSLASKRLTTILVIGGGSAMDLSKAIAALHGLLSPSSLTADAVRQAILQKAYAAKESFVKLIAVPTTAGTGSEVTRWATVWDPDRKQKLSVDHICLFPKAAVIVPEFTAAMGPELTLSTGLDALSHAMEAYWANSSTPLSKALALTAVDHICGALPMAIAPENKENLQIRETMCLGALIAGLSFSITRTTACHAISYPLTMLHGLPHGFAVAVTLSAVMKRNAAVLPQIQALSDCLKKYGGLDTWLSRLTGAGKPLRLSAFGIKQVDLPAIADLSFTAGRMDNNPIVFDKQQVIAILQESL